MGVDDIIAGALFYNNVLTSSLIHTQFAYATVNHELNSHSNNEPPNSQKIFMSNGHDLTPRYCLGRREYCALRPHSDHKRGITVSIQHCTVVVSSDHNSIPRCTLVISSLYLLRLADSQTPDSLGAFRRNKSQVKSSQPCYYTPTAVLQLY